MTTEQIDAASLATMTTDELLEQLGTARGRMHTIQEALDTRLSLDDGWTVDPVGHMAGGVTVHGTVEDRHSGNEQAVSLCVYGDGQYAAGAFIVTEGERSATVPLETLRGALKLLDEREAARLRKK